MRKRVLFVAAFAALTLGGLQAKHDRDDECSHDRHYRGHYRDADDRDDDRDEHRQGHGRREGLPPGLEKQLARNGHLPPGLEKKMRPVPAGICRRMPPLPEGASRGYYGGHVIVFNPRTFLVLDVFAGISISH